MASTSQSIRLFVEHPVTRLSVGLILFSSGFAEAYRSFAQDYEHLRIGVHHGVMLFGLFNMIASIPDLIEGVATSAEYLEHLEQRRKKDVEG